jgi:quercetin dioxygenase-like cupin family protein
VNFSQGCTTGRHTRDRDQVPIVTAGSGIGATEHQRREINVGDVAHIKAGERHRHGAEADDDGAYHDHALRQQSHLGIDASRPQRAGGHCSSEPV